MRLLKAASVVVAILCVMVGAAAIVNERYDLAAANLAILLVNLYLIRGSM